MATSTKDRILNVAERLFAVNGLDGTSLRQITREAKVNLAAVNYHFGSKEGLIHAAFQRRVGAINQERLRMLSEYERSIPKGEPLDLRKVLDCFIRPVFYIPGGGLANDPLFLRLIGRLYTDPAEHMRQVFLREFAVVLERYRQALMRALPELDEEEAVWRLHFTIGTLAHSLLTADTLKEFTNGLCDPGDFSGMLPRLVEFCLAGVQAGIPSPVAVH